MTEDVRGALAVFTVAALCGIGALATASNSDTRSACVGGALLFTAVGLLVLLRGLFSRGR